MKFGLSCYGLHLLLLFAGGGMSFPSDDPFVYGYIFYMILQKYFQSNIFNFSQTITDAAAPTII